MRLLRYLIRITIVLGMRRNKLNYAAAEITYLNRDKNVQTAYTYPVTKVILRERDKPENERIFIVDKDGKWYEEK